MGASADYRNTEHCPVLMDVAIRKSVLEEKIKSEHKRISIFYNKVKDKNGEYFKSFAKIYHGKCAYCGASIKFTDIRLFEVDHYICESAFSKDTDGRAAAGRLGNLIFSCYSCNRGKGALHITDKYLPLLNPDDNSIARFFVGTMITI